jgi:hypothetical protein
MAFKFREIMIRMTVKITSSIIDHGLFLVLEDGNNKDAEHINKTIA